MKGFQTRSPRDGEPAGESGTGVGEACAPGTAPGEAREWGRRRLYVLGVLSIPVVFATSWLFLLVTGDTAACTIPPILAGIGLWRLGRLDRRALGLRRGAGSWAAATLLPLGVVGCTVWLAASTGAARVVEVDVGRLALQVSSMTILVALGVVLTEDAFFRGALWGALDRAGASSDALLLWTAGAYALWYLPILWLEPGGAATGAEALAVHALNLWLLGLCWGILRLASGSLLVVAWAHGLWSGLAYTLFGYGVSGGALAVVDPLRFDPERGWAGIAFNAAAVLALWRWHAGRSGADADAPDGAPSEADRGTRPSARDG